MIFLKWNVEMLYVKNTKFYFAGFCARSIIIPGQDPYGARFKPYLRTAGLGELS